VLPVELALEELSTPLPRGLWVCVGVNFGMVEEPVSEQ
jgi:hypothetical protein